MTKRELLVEYQRRAEKARDDAFTRVLASAKVDPELSAVVSQYQTYKQVIIDLRKSLESYDGG